MKTYKIKNIISGMMLVVGVAIQLTAPDLQNEANQQLQTCNQKFITHLGQQIYKIRLSFNNNQLKTIIHNDKGE